MPVLVLVLLLLIPHAIIIEGIIITTIIIAFATVIDAGFRSCHDVR
jgi:hypothetical protein